MKSMMISMSSRCMIGFMVVLMTMSYNLAQALEPTPVYSDFENKKICKVQILFEVPGTKLPLFLWAIVDFDPLVGYRKQLEQSKQFIINWTSKETDKKKREEMINSIIGDMWNRGFQHVTGDQLYLFYMEKPGEINKLNTNDEGKRWFITKTLEYPQSSLCWSIPLELKTGKQIDIKLTKTNAVGLSAMAEEILSKPESLSIAVKPNPFHDAMLKALHDAQTLYYHTAIKHSYQEDRICTLSVWLKKPNYARIEYAPGGKLGCVLVGDGENFWIYWPDYRPRMARETEAEYEATKTKRYLRLDATPHMHSIWHMVSKLGTGLMAFQPSYFHDCPFAVDQTIDSIITLGEDTVPGYTESFDYIEVSMMNNQRSRYYWLSKQDHLPRKVKDDIRVSKETFNEEIWSNVKLNQDMPDSLFIWKPPEGWIEYIEPTLYSGLLKIGDPAPDFSFPTLKGETFTLSEMKGKVVLINFWRVGCPPCREELPWLESMFQKYKNKNFIVIGYNATDDEKYVRELLTTNNVTYPNILNASQEAKDIMLKKYQKAGMAAVPLNYLIDRDGNVSSVWYGYGEEQNNDDKIIRLLEE